MRLLALLMMAALPASAQVIDAITPIGQVTLPHLMQYKNTPVGGLSGLTYDAKTDQFYAISDDRSDRAPARFYAFKVALKDGHLASVTPTGEWPLTVNGKPYGEDKIDSEGIAIAGDTLFVSSEGDVRVKQPPFVDGFSLTGQRTEQLPIPTPFQIGPQHGIRNNLAFETLTTSPNKQWLYTATESALLQDGPDGTAQKGASSRILVYSLKSHKPVHQYRYDIDPAVKGRGTMIGVSDMVALDNNGHLLAIERSYSHASGNRLRLYEVDLNGATDISGVDSIKSMVNIKPAKKHLVADFAKLKLPLDNGEGIAIGPTLADGSRLLLMVSDDNFSHYQHTYFWAFKIKLAH